MKTERVGQQSTKMVCKCRGTRVVVGVDDEERARGLGLMGRSMILTTRGLKGNETVAGVKPAQEISSQLEHTLSCELAGIGKCRV